MTSKFEFVTAVHASLGKKWPYPGALADAMGHCKNNKTVEQTVEAIKAKAVKHAARTQVRR